MNPQRWKARQFKHRRYRRCRYCPRLLTFETATVDHIKPRSKGGTNDPSNFAISCWQCNHDKGDKHEEREPLDRYAPDPWWPVKAQ